MPGSAAGAELGGTEGERLDLSVAIPVFNEADNLTPLCDELLAALRPLGRSFELLFVDDGSTDGSREVLRALAAAHPEVRVVLFRRNFGQTAAMAAGADLSRGEVLVFIDADRQNDPADIPALVRKLDEGFDVVCGWRKVRKDRALSRRLPSRLANGLIRKVAGVQIHDLGCTLKAFRREVIREVKLYGEMHRFVPIYAAAVGARITEMVVNHRPRVAGVTKYGLGRTARVLFDLVTVKFLVTYSARPMHFFGGTAVWLFAGSGVSGVGMVVNKLLNGISMIRSPLLLLSAMLFMLAVNFVLMGLLAEVLARTYFESQGKTSYRVLEIVARAPVPHG